MCFRLLVVYGPQEDDHIDQINNFYENLSLQRNRASVTGDPVLIVGNFNNAKGLVIKYREGGGWAGRNRGWVINFQADKKGWVT